MDKETSQRYPDTNIIRNDEFYRQMFTNHPAIMFLVDPFLFKIIEANKAASRFYGYACEQLAGMELNKINTSSEDNIKTLTTKAVDNNGTVFTGKHRLSTGELKDVEVHTAPISFDGKTLLFSIIRDVTDRFLTEEKNRETQQALRESEENYRMLFLEMLNGFALHDIILDENGKPCDYRFLDVNPSFEKLTGMTREKVLGKTVRQVLPEVEQYWIDTYGEVAIKGESIYYENYAAELDRYYESYAYCPKPGQFAVVINDITRRKEAEKELKRHAQELALFNKAMIDREKRIIELKEEVNQLCRISNQPEKYPPIWKLEK